LSNDPGHLLDYQAAKSNRPPGVGYFILHAVYGLSTSLGMFLAYLDIRNAGDGWGRLFALLFESPFVLVQLLGILPATIYVSRHPNRLSAAHKILLFANALAGPALTAIGVVVDLATPVTHGTC